MIGFDSLTEMADIHCHLLPYVDDGAADTDEAYELILNEYAQGVRLIIITVHLRYGMFDTDVSNVLKHFDNLKSMLSQENMKDLEVFVSREYYCDERFEAILDGYASGAEKIIYEDKEYFPKKEIMPIGKNNCILLEFSSGKIQKNEFEVFIKKSVSAGLTPIIAHVERYPAVWSNMTLVDNMKNYGAYIQVNADSILGKESRQRVDVARTLLKSGALDIVCSDAHDTEFRTPNMKKCYKYLKSKFGKDTAAKLMHDNAYKLVKRFDR
ncbi:MAG: hypothetical protein K6A23_04995 [Butyrivibrio sp.]|nr:hypothetical protein [Butyrivibrio sp.]